MYQKQKLYTTIKIKLQMLLTVLLSALNFDTIFFHCLKTAKGFRWGGGVQFAPGKKIWGMKIWQVMVFTSIYIPMCYHFHSQTIAWPYARQCNGPWVEKQRRVKIVQSSLVQCLSLYSALKVHVVPRLQNKIRTSKLHQ